jgi:starch-binding outer membrane protein, SusD/RagB family
MRTRYIFFICILVWALITPSCKKYLEEKSNAALATPESLNDLQAILDDPNLYLTTGFNLTASDEYYFDSLSLSQFEIYDQEAYRWDPKANGLMDWQVGYSNIFSANTVLDQLELIKEQGDNTQRNSIKGMALFVRAYNFFNLAQLFAPQYDAGTASADLGIVLRLNSNFNEKSIRSTVQKTYDQIVEDIQAALLLLPATSPGKTRPNKTSALALLARVYLQMEDYAKAKKAAEDCIALSNELLNYNDFDPQSDLPFGDYTSNTEILYFIIGYGLPSFDYIAWIDLSLYDSYDPNDLRKELFFRDNFDGTYSFKGNYNQDLFSLLNGVTLDEVYLISAESKARLNDLNGAMMDLNTLLEKRWRVNEFQPFSANTPDEALSIILQERKKELVYRGTRWWDLRRLNKDPRFAVTIQRDIGGIIYELPPNDLRYTFLIPREVIQMTEIEQNPR